jgi:hypothetical protein
MAALLLVALFAADHLVAQTSELSRQSRDVPGATDSARPDTRALWRDPGEVEKLDLANGPEGPGDAPQPPFRFVEENLLGSSPKIRVMDARGVAWMVKFGDEVSSQTFAARLVWSAGYFAIPTYFVASGSVSGVGVLKRAKGYVKSDGQFDNASFERFIDLPIQWLGDTRSWSWNSNPFVGTPELNGLKILLMLLSDWDNKDARDVEHGSNTAILVYPGGETHYAVVDWGGSMGKWGGYLERNKWRCGDYSQQTPDFIKGVRGNVIQWGYSGQHTTDFTQDVHVDDVVWLLKYLGRIDDAQLRGGLVSSGASRADVECFVKAIRNRISQLQSITRESVPPRNEPQLLGDSRSLCRKREHRCIELRTRVRGWVTIAGFPAFVVRPMWRAGCLAEGGVPAAERPAQEAT